MLRSRFRATLGLAGFLALSVAGCDVPQGGGILENGVLRDFPRNPERPLRQGLGANGKHIIFCNFDGATLTANYDDAMHNASSIAYSVGHSVTIPPFYSPDFSTTKSRDQVISDVMAKVRLYFQDFNVDVVSTRPTSGNYVMAMVGGTANLVGESSQVAGLAPLDCGRDNQGKTRYNTQDDVEVIFAFSGMLHDPAYRSGSYTFDIGNVAATIAQEVGHAYGLGHSNNKSDVMYPVLQSPLPSGFLAGPYADNGNCAGSVGSQDSHAILIQVLGGATTARDLAPPTVSFTTPKQGQTVGRQVTVTVAASDDVGVDHVVVTATGVVKATQTFTAAPYTMTVAATTDGLLSLAAVAYDAVGNQAAAAVTVAVSGGTVTPMLLPLGSACSAGTQCQSGLCTSNACTQGCDGAVACPSGWHCGPTKVCEAGDPVAPTLGEVGAACAAAAECKSGLCAEQGATKFCSTACTIGDATSCPDGLVCATQGDGSAQCAFAADNGNTVNGGCSVATGRAGQALPLEAMLLVGLLLLGLRLRRRA